MNIKDLKQYEIESEPEQTKSKPLNLSDIGNDYTVEEDTSFIPESLKAGAAGAAESATFGFAPEIGAGIQSLFGDKSYKEYEAENEAAFRKLEQDNPASYLTGELAGAVGQGLVTGGLGTAAKVAQGVGKAAPLVGRLALTGAGTGAASGLGYSKESAIDALSGDTEAQKELGKDVVVGGITGAIGNAAMPYIAKGAGKALEAGGKAAGKVISVVPGLEDLMQTYNLARSGKAVAGKEAKEILGKDATIVAKDLAKGFSKQGKTASVNIGKALKSASLEEGDVAKFITDAEKRAASGRALPDDAAKIQNLLDQYKDTVVKETVTPGEELAVKKLELLKEKLQNEASALGQTVDFIPMERSKNYLNALQKGVDAEGNPIVKPISELIPEDLVTKEVSESVRPGLDLQDVYNLRGSMGELARGNSLEKVGQIQAKSIKSSADQFIDEKLSEEARQQLAASKLDFESTKRAANMIPGLEDTKKLGKDSFIKAREALLSPSENTSFKLEEALDLGKEEFISPVLKDEARQIALRSKLNKESGKMSITGLTPSVRGMGIIGTEQLAKVVGSKVAQSPKEFTKKMLNTSEAGLVNMASKLPKTFADSITNALKDSTKKDRLMWAISQQPAFREAVNRLTDSEETVNLEPLDVNIDN